MLHELLQHETLCDCLPNYVFMVQFLQQGNFTNGSGGHPLFLLFQPAYHARFKLSLCMASPMTKRQAVLAPDLLQGKDSLGFPVLGLENNAIRAFTDLPKRLVLAFHTCMAG